jgi:preprotein translocase SecE subunit
MEAVAENPTIFDRLRTYRADQGRYVRLATFWSLTFLWGYGCYRFAEALWDLGFSWASWLRTQLVEELPLVEWPLTPAKIIAVVTFLLGLAALQAFLNRPKVAETLIETEAELRKVTWPTTKDTVQSSVVVLLTVLILLGLMAGFDIILSQIFDFLLYRRAGG